MYQATILSTRICYTTYYSVAFAYNCVANCAATPEKLFPAASFEYLYYGSMAIINILSLPVWGSDRLETSESDVFRRQILTSEDCPH